MRTSQPLSFSTLALLLLCHLTMLALAAFYFRFIALGSFQFSFSLNFLWMGWISVVMVLQKPALQSPYYACHPLEQGGTVYRLVGIRLFWRGLALIGWELARRKGVPVHKTQAALARYERMTREAEFGHLVVALLVTALSVGVVATHSWYSGRWLLGLNVLFNIYPIMLQRYNRPRVQRALRTLQVRAERLAATQLAKPSR